ncbi:MAG: DUF3885 domain-containing protein [Hyphomonadaceae bacterium]|nr:DUF3885 domain-containing protein [Clostridia bacterium]
MKLLKQFNELITKKFKVNALGSPVFYNFPIGIRFEIGNGSPFEKNTKEIKKSYVENCIFRANKIFQDIFNNNDEVIIVIDSNEDNLSIIETLTSDYIDCFSFDCKYDEEDECVFKRLLYKVKVESVNFLRLIEEIIWSDLGRMNGFNSSIYIISIANETIYFLYDDRGLDVVASNKVSIESLYYKYNDWILEYDRDKINLLFDIQL